MMNWLRAGTFILRAGGLVSTCWKVFPKFCPLCNKQVIAMSPRRIKDKFHLYFQSFPKFCENFENTRENISLILLGLMRLHIQIPSL